MSMLYEDVLAFTFVFWLVSWLKSNSDDRCNRITHRGIPFRVVACVRPSEERHEIIVLSYVTKHNNLDKNLSCRIFRRSGNPASWCADSWEWEFR